MRINKNAIRESRGDNEIDDYIYAQMEEDEFEFFISIGQCTAPHNDENVRYLTPKVNEQQLKVNGEEAGNELV